MVTFTVRIPDDLHQQIKRIAKAEDRSMNAQLVHLLKRAASEYERGQTKEM